MTLALHQDPNRRWSTVEPLTPGASSVWPGSTVGPLVALQPQQAGQWIQQIGMQAVLRFVEHKERGQAGAEQGCQQQMAQGASASSLDSSGRGRLG